MDSSAQKIDKNFSNRNSNALKLHSCESYYSISISAELSMTNSNSHNSAKRFRDLSLSYSNHYYRCSYKWCFSMLNWLLMLDSRRGKCRQLRLSIFTVIGHLQRVHQSYNSDACFACNDGLFDCCLTESLRRPRCVAGVRFGRLSFLILIVDDAWQLDCRLVFGEPEYQAYHCQFILF